MYSCECVCEGACVCESQWQDKEWRHELKIHRHIHTQARCMSTLSSSHRDMLPSVWKEWSVNSQKKKNNCKKTSHEKLDLIAIKNNNYNKYHQREDKGKIILLNFPDAHCLEISPHHLLP